MSGCHPNRMTGSSSGGGDYEHEDDLVPGLWNNTSQTPDTQVGSDAPDRRLYLSKNNAGGLWWEDKAIVDAVSNSFMRTFQFYAVNWKEASIEHRNLMFDYFQSHVRADDGYDLRGEWEKRIKRRITQIIHNAYVAKKRPSWMHQSYWERLKKRKEEDPEFAANSDKSKVNRRSGGEDGKALGTHTLGRKNAAVVFKELGADATPYKLMEVSKKDKKGNWICPRASRTDVDYKKEMSQPLPDGEGTPDPFRVYYNVAGGFDKKMRVFGTGPLAQELFTPPANRSRPTTPSYSPTIISQFANENAQLKEQISRMEMTQQESMSKLGAVEARAQADRLEILRQRALTERMNAFLAEKYGWSMDPNCSGGPTPGPRDDFADDGHGFGSQQVHL